MTDWEATEQRLDARSAERRGRLARRDRRRSWMPWLLAPLVFPALGAAALLAVIEREGGDLGGWPEARAIGVIAACFFVPALVSAWAARRRGVVETIGWAVVCVCAQAALVVGVGFVALGLGPR